MELAGLHLNAIQGVLGINRPGRLQDLLEQVGPWILGADLAQVGPELDTDPFQAMATLAVHDGFGAEDRAAATRVPLQVQDGPRVDDIAEPLDSLRFGHEPFEEVADLG